MGALLQRRSQVQVACMSEWGSLCASLASFWVKNLMYDNICQSEQVLDIRFNKFLNYCLTRSFILQLLSGSSSEQCNTESELFKATKMRLFGDLCSVSLLHLMELRKAMHKIVKTIETTATTTTKSLEESSSI